MDNKNLIINLKNSYQLFYDGMNSFCEIGYPLAALISIVFAFATKEWILIWITAISIIMAFIVRPFYVVYN